MNATDDSVDFSITNSYIKDWIVNNYLSQIKYIFKADFNISEVNIILNETKIDNIESISPNKNLYNIGIELNSTYTFENFVIGESNKLAYSVAKSFVEGDKMCNPLFLYGSVGLGKTHLLQSVAWEMKSKFPNKDIVYISANKFMTLYVDACRNQTTNDFKEQFKHINVLLIDDVQFLAGKEATQKEFFYTFNTLLDDGKQIILACDKNPDNLENIDKSLISKMKTGIVIDIKESDDELKYEIAKTKAKLLGLDCNNLVLKYIAESFGITNRDIEGTIRKLLMEQKFFKKEVDLKKVSDILNEKKKLVNCEYIQCKVAEYFKITTSEILSKKRDSQFILPRHIAFYLARKITKKSYPELGKHFEKNHATIINGCEKIELEIKNNNFDTINIISNIEKLIFI
ncbi:MAG: chromosomal replication initiator protein DnaA [Rickettsiales bacterium]|nr:MAG: chromosomal replication initiator protein DnaA [Rickettsiales bacterium]